jgi:hypothetical protein
MGHHQNRGVLVGDPFDAGDVLGTDDSTMVAQCRRLRIARMTGSWYDKGTAVQPCSFQLDQPSAGSNDVDT